ncbi:MAG: ATP-binding protein [Gammaproteobacteria bacterium]|nr:ATP-binding protein [Gammaproteobacteria bacterium]MBQ0773814.1 ATP-binding protein [Gammaproteobacteria bacterium]
MENKIVRLAVSGTYSSGKTTTTEALSIATGIPRTHAKTSREILMEDIPGKQVQDLSAGELIQLGLRRLEERIHNEAMQQGSFISDGSVVHEWVYGEARMQVGINPSANIVHRVLNEIVGLPVKRFYKAYMNAYGQVVKNRAKRLYDAYVHLPVEFAMVADNHRPVSEPFRALSDEILLKVLDDIEIPYHIVRGTIPERVEQIMDIFKFDVVVPVNEAIDMAKERVAADLAVLEADARHHSKNRDESVIQRVKYALRY